jgi:hypothetical protein
LDREQLLPSLGTTMTLPDERYRALKQGKKLLEELCDPGRTPRVPSLIRDRARAALRHYPNDYELDTIADKCPDYLDKQTFSVYTNGVHK